MELLASPFAASQTAKAMNTFSAATDRMMSCALDAVARAEQKFRVGSMAG
jgi:hypothetical protein